MHLNHALLFAAALFFGLNGAGNAQETDSQAELAKKLANPVANLVSVPLENNTDFGIGPAEAHRNTLNIQPVIPFSISQDWNLITRTIVPLINAEAPASGLASEFGTGDIVQSFFFSPKEPVDGWVVGAGPVMLYPGASNPALGGEKWGAGPTAVVLKQDSGFTYGMLANHLWSFAGKSGRDDINATYLQPFLTYTTKTYTTFGADLESTYDWKAEQWTVPANFTVAQLIKIGGVPVQFKGGWRIYSERPAGGPDWGLRFAVTFLFPK